MTQEALNQWHTERQKLSLLLFDEIEKASGALCVAFPLANLVATGQIKLGDFIRIDIDATGKMIFVKEKEAEGALVPVLLEKYGPEFVTQSNTERASRPVSRREAAGGSLLDHK